MKRMVGMQACSWEFLSARCWELVWSTCRFWQSLARYTLFPQTQTFSLSLSLDKWECDAPATHHISKAALQHGLALDPQAHAPDVHFEVHVLATHFF